MNYNIMTVSVSGVATTAAPAPVTTGTTTDYQMPCKGTTEDWGTNWGDPDTWECCTSSEPCGIDEGDCDSDSDCEGSLKCGHDNCATTGLFDSLADCCYEEGTT